MKNLKKKHTYGHKYAPGPTRERPNLSWFLEPFPKCTHLNSLFLKSLTAPVIQISQGIINWRQKGFKVFFQAFKSCGYFGFTLSARCLANCIRCGYQWIAFGHWKFLATEFQGEWVVQMVMFQPPFSLKPYCLIRIWHFSNWNGTLPLHWININVNVTAFGSQRAKTDKMYKIQCNVFVLSFDWNSLIGSFWWIWK